MNPANSRHEINATADVYIVKNAKALLIQCKAIDADIKSEN